MIEKIIRCDLCNDVLKASSERPGRRLRWAEGGIVLLDLYDNAASEKAICGKCLAGLQFGLDKEKQRERA